MLFFLPCAVNLMLVVASESNTSPHAVLCELNITPVRMYISLGKILIDEGFDIGSLSRIMINFRIILCQATMSDH